MESRRVGGTNFGKVKANSSFKMVGGKMSSWVGRREVETLWKSRCSVICTGLGSWPLSNVEHSGMCAGKNKVGRQLAFGLHG